MKELLETLCDKYLLNLGLFTDFYPLEGIYSIRYVLMFIAPRTRCLS